MFLPAASPVAKLLPEADKLAEIGIRLAETIVVAVLIQWALFLAIRRLEKFLASVEGGGEQSRQRAKTLGGVLRHTSEFIVVGGALIHGLDVLGWDIKPILAGAGVLGLAIGFGAQSLVRDTISGIFILAENQYGVGDLVEVNGKPATVEELSLRFTRLRDFNGYVYFVPNGEMKIVVNRSRDWQRLAVDVPVASDQNLDSALDVCRRVADAMNADAAWKERLLDPVEVWGIELLGATEATFRFVVRGRPGSDAVEAARTLRQRAHRALVAAGFRSSVAREITVQQLPTGAAPSPARSS
jgi:small-conductance mechanosensitive channel